MRYSSRPTALTATMRRWAPLLIGTAIGFAFSLAVGCAMGNPLP